MKISFGGTVNRSGPALEGRQDEPEQRPHAVEGIERQDRDGRRHTRIEAGGSRIPSARAGSQWRAGAQLGTPATQLAQSKVTVLDLVGADGVIELVSGTSGGSRSPRLIS